MEKQERTRIILKDLISAARKAHKICRSSVHVDVSDSYLKMLRELDGAVSRAELHLKDGGI